ncbi:MAG: WbqC family protein [Bacteroidales bacterium]|nr:WbqC family protein [Bacteroidales bacterium]
MAEILLSTAYLPNIQYIRAIAQNQDATIELFENFPKQTFRNRCHILTEAGASSLSIPVVKGNSKHYMRDTKISYNERWQPQHWHAIVSAYNSSPYFEYFRDDLEPIIRRQFTYLIDLNNEINDLIFRILNIKTNIHQTSEYIEPDNASFTDLRSAIHPKKSQTVGENYYDETPYPQVFDSKFGFVPNLSIIDMIFNVGVEAGELVKQA